MREPTRLLMEALGYQRLYPPQEEALRRGVEEGRSLLVATPTASGKTFIGLAAAANRLLEEPGSRAFYLVPLKSVALEKYRAARALRRLGVEARLVVGDRELGPRGGGLVVTTYEKLDSMLRRDPGLLRGASLVVVDEVHYIGEPRRGVVLESLLARILMRGERPQIVALSATVPNAAEIAEWLGAEPLVMDWRPVPLREAVYKDGRLLYPRERGEEPVPRPTREPALDLAAWIARDGGQALVFSMSRRRAVQLARRAAEKLRGRLSYDEQGARRLAARILRETGGPRVLREELARLVERGVAFHHAGLGPGQRELVEEGFRMGWLGMVSATPTLAAGVNLPARLVVVAEYYRFQDGMRRPIPVSEYKQMSGRAGRPGYDREGVSVVVAAPGDDPWEVAEHYVLSPPEPVRSRLAGLQGLRHAVLGLVASLGGAEWRAVEEFARSTLYARQEGWRLLAPLLRRAAEQLSEWGLVERRGGRLEPTMLGLEASRSYLDPASVATARRLLAGLRVEPGDLALLFIIARLPDAATLPASRREVPGLLDRLIEEAPELVDALSDFDLPEARAFKTALALRMWIEEAGEDEIHRETGAQPGDLAAVVESASWLAGSLARLAGLLPEAPGGLGGRLRVLEQRIRHGVRPELLPLVAIPGVGRVRARRLYERGYRSLADLARASPRELLSIPGLGPSTVRGILEFLGRGEEAERLSQRRGPRGLEEFL